MLEKALVKSDDACRRILNAPHANLDSGDELADAVEAAGLHDGWVLTPTGRRSTARGALEQVITDPVLLKLLKYRGALTHLLSNFGRPWQYLSSEFNGRLHPEWNQVRQSRNGENNGANNFKGTRTGRLSCMRPNFQNMPNEYEDEKIPVPRGYPELPLMRQYILPDAGYVWCKRDYSQQELRILAHYSEGRLFDRYKANPKIDAHEETQALIREYANRELIRKHVKITGFSIIYGSGVQHLSQMLGVDVNEGRATRDGFGGIGITLDTEGGIVRVGYADQNGHPFRSIGRILIERGELTADRASMQGIKEWGRRNPDKLLPLLDENPSYVFFREVPPPTPGTPESEIDGPIGKLGVPLLRERTLAVDTRSIPLGAPVFLATTYPLSSRPLSRLVMAQDTGGAIRGAVRADFFWGTGPEAGALAGRMRQQGRMWVLLPKEMPAP
jgi:3D (Asp-Asp-Asp) domain-containing protein